MGITPKQWSGQKFVLKKTFNSDELAAREGYTVGKWYYVLEDEHIPRKKEYFLINVTAKTQTRGWIRIQIKVPVIYGDPWKEDLKSDIEKELKGNLDLIGVFLSDVDQEWCRGFDLSWED
jgi:hypothetical protein